MTFYQNGLCTVTDLFSNFMLEIIMRQKHVKASIISQSFEAERWAVFILSECTVNLQCEFTTTRELCVFLIQNPWSGFIFKQTSLLAESTYIVTAFQKWTYLCDKMYSNYCYKDGQKDLKLLSLKVFLALFKCIFCNLFGMVSFFSPYIIVILGKLLL